MMTLVPKHWFSWDFVLSDSVGKPYGDIALSSWRERGSVRVDEQEYRVSREGLLGPFVLTSPNGELARAVKESAFKQKFTLSVEGRPYTLKRLSGWRREFGLFEGDTHLGSVAPEGWLTRRARVELPDDLPGWARAFVVWLTLLIVEARLRCRGCRRELIGVPPNKGMKLTKPERIEALQLIAGVMPHSVNARVVPVSGGSLFPSGSLKYRPGWCRFVAERSQ
jgi:hypothetical protein